MPFHIELESEYVRTCPLKVLPSVKCIYVKLNAVLKKEAVVIFLSFFLGGRGGGGFRVCSHQPTELRTVPKHTSN